MEKKEEKLKKNKNGKEIEINEKKKRKKPEEMEKIRREIVRKRKMGEKWKKMGKK